MNKDNFYYNKNLKEFARKLRKDSTKAEIVLWKEVLRGGKMHGYTFLRQRPVLNYIADFMCKRLMLIIEVDDFMHKSEEQWKLDKERQKELEEAGFTVLRFTDDEVPADLRNVERVIEYWLLNHLPAPPLKGDNPRPYQDGGPI
ncbi:MAG TPA: endonuclease domain-containing protein [Balneolaceae bacterium]|nr:endonuclease domain-containing protein [Balneolaceae bacterium]